MTQDQNLVIIPESKLEEINRNLVSIKELITGKRKQHSREIGGIELAIEVTGLSKGTIYQLVHKNEIPFQKNGKLYFERTKLINWIKSGKKGGES